MSEEKNEIFPRKLNGFSGENNTTNEDLKRLKKRRGGQGRRKE